MTTRPLLMTVGLSLLVGPIAAQEAEVPDSALAARIERVASGLLLPVQVRGRAPDPYRLDDRMRDHRVPAVSVAVIERGEVAWTRAWGVADAEIGRPATAETLFQAASISKPVAALALLRLAESGALDLDADVDRYLPDWKILRVRGARGDVSLRLLLSHRAGLTVHGFRGYASDEDIPTTPEILSGSGPANSPPVVADLPADSVWRYSGGGYTVAQHVAEVVTGQPFDRQMRDILDALNMTSSTYAQPLPDSLAGKAAVGYREDTAPVAGRWHTYPEMAAAGLWTTPRDLARYLLAVGLWLRGATDGVVSPDMTRTMLTPGLNGWGLGPSTAGEGLDFRFQHGGANEGFRSQFVYFPRRGIGAVLMTNGDSGEALIQELLFSIAAEYEWPNFAPREVRAVEMTAGEAREFAGRYRVEEAPDIDVVTSWRGGHLEVRIGDSRASELIPVAADRFINAADGTMLRFERDAGGRVSAVVAYGSRAGRVRRP